MVLGEVRDQETARNAVQGADTGHMVFATLHTATIASSLTRLRALGVEPHEMRLILRGVLVQALVRTLCKVCEGTGTFEGHRCPNPLCHGTGYGARTIISECTSFKSPEDVDECIALLNEQPTDANGKKQPVKMPWPSMIDDAIDKMVAGETTSNELKRIFGSELDDRLRQRRLDPDHYILPKLRDKH
jgi:general secretion pathway protein E